MNNFFFQLNDPRCCNDNCNLYIHIHTRYNLCWKEIYGVFERAKMKVLNLRINKRISIFNLFSFSSYYNYNSYLKKYSKRSRSEKNTGWLILLRIYRLSFNGCQQARQSKQKKKSHISIIPSSFFPQFYPPIFFYSFKSKNKKRFILRNFSPH